MIRLTFNEEEWQHEIIDDQNRNGEVLAAVYNLNEAEELLKFYQRQEEDANERDRVETAMEEDASIYWSWRNQDELSGE